jgi:hypothetical protein
VNILDAALAMSRTLDRAGVEHMLVGAVAIAYYGITRSTMDADFVVQLAGQKISSIQESLDPGFHLNPQPRFELFTGNTYYAISLLQTPYSIDLFALSDDPFDQRSFARRRHVIVQQQSTWIQSPEDLVVQKLRWQRLKDLSDVQDVLALQGDTLDFAYIEPWCDAHSTRELLERVRREIPPLS